MKNKSKLGLQFLERNVLLNIYVFTAFVYQREEKETKSIMNSLLQSVKNYNLYLTEIPYKMRMRIFKLQLSARKTSADTELKLFL